MPDAAAQRQQILFMSLVTMLAENGMMALGKIVPPGAEEPILDLELARVMIDTLDVLKARTKGNLEAEEGRFLETHLTNLRLNFLETQKQQAAGEAEDPEPPDEGSAE